MLTVVERAPVGRTKPRRIVTGRDCRLPWAWDELMFLMPMDWEANAAYDVTRRYKATLAGSAVMSENHWGLALDGTANTAGSGTATSWADFNSAATSPFAGLQKLSAVIVCLVDGFPTVSNTTAKVFAKESTVSLQFLQTPSGGFSWTVYGDPPGGPSTIVGRSAAGGIGTGAGAWGVLGMSWDGLNISSYSSGILQATASADFGSNGLGNDAAYKWYMMGNHNAAGGGTTPRDAFKGRVALVVFWDRVLSATEHAAIGQDPFGLISPRRESPMYAWPPLFPTNQVVFGTLADADVNARSGAMQTLNVTMPPEFGSTVHIERADTSVVDRTIAADDTLAEPINSTDPEDPTYIAFYPEPED